MDKPTLNKFGLPTRDYILREGELKRALKLAKSPGRREKVQAQLDELHARRAAEAHERLGSMGNPQMICPHCQMKGSVITQKTKLKQGISGGKATGAVLTGGLSLLATGLSRKQKFTQAHCSNCGADWLF